MMNDTLKKLTQTIEFSDIFKALPVYDEFRTWQLALQSGHLDPIREEVINVMVKSEKSALSLILDQALFLTDEQKETLKQMHHSQLDANFSQLKEWLAQNGVLR